MGLSMDQINSGAADAGTLIGRAMDAWDRIQRSIHPVSATPPIAATTGGAVPPTSQTQQGAQAPAIGGTWLILGALAALVLLSRRR
jgi:hypothetical protein